ncbi:patched domain-containing protein 3-like [Amphiura filiformis]|uniref:patched domain-containing protein 3-like n=1 Tax=Amphiura filiformis TaxID=82378 RepID=UPI003B217AA4
MKLGIIRRFLPSTSYSILNADGDDLDEKSDPEYSVVQVNIDDQTTTDVQILDPDNNNSETTREICCKSCGPLDCIDHRLRHLFAAWGRIVARHPWPILLLPILVTIGLSVGFRYVTMETNQEKIYTPQNGKAKTERKIVDELFSSVSWEDHATPARLTELGRYIQIIFTTDDDQNVLILALLDKAYDVHQMVLDHITISGNVSYRYENLCIKWHDSCLANTVLTLYEDNEDYFTDNNISYPYSFLPDGNVGFLGAELGDVELWMEDEIETQFSPVKSAKTFRLLYYLKSEGEFDEINSKFESFVIKRVRKMSADWEDVNVVTFTSRTPDDEVKAATYEMIVLFPIAAALLLIFTVGSCMTKDPVRSKPWLAIAALVSTLLAMLSALGVMFFVGVPFVDMVVAMPFIIIGRGLDDAFIMLAAWRQTDTNLPVERRMSLTLADSVMSITATTVTDTLAFTVGSISSFVSIRTFCVYTGLAVVFDYIYQITFFAACMVFSGRREAAGRHCFTMKRIQKPYAIVATKRDEVTDFVSKMDKQPDNTTKSYGQEDHAFMTFFRNYFGPFILNPCMKVIVVFIYLGYIGVAIWGCSMVEQGLTEQDLVRQGSEASKFLDLKYKYFKTYEPAVSLVIKTEQNYWEAETQEIIERTLSKLEEDKHFHDSSMTISWLHEYKRFLELVGISNITKDLFMSILREQFLLIPAFEPFQLDIVFDETNTSIKSSRYFVLGKDLFTSNDEKAMMLKARQVAKDCELMPLLTPRRLFTSINS